MPDCPAPDFHQCVGDTLLYRGWHPREIAVANKPGSKWILTDPGLRIRLVMARDLAGPYAELSAVHLPGTEHTAPLWKATAHAADAPTILAAATAAPHHEHECGGTWSDRRAINRALRTAGWTTTAGHLAVLTAATVTWTAPENGTATDRALRWTTPGRRGAGGWEITGPGLHIQATAATPPAVLLAIAHPHSLHKD